MSKNKPMPYDFLKESYEEACSLLLTEQAVNRRYASENEYMTDFIHWKNLEKEYQYFKENAIRDSNEEIPFPRYILN